MNRSPSLTRASTYFPIARSQRVRHLIIVAACLLAVAIGYGSVHIYRVGASGRELLALLVLSVLCLTPAIVQSNRGRFELFDPVNAFSFTFFLAFVVGPTLMFLRGLVGVNGISLRLQLAPALTIAAVGLTSAYFGSWWISRRERVWQAQTPKTVDYSAHNRNEIFGRLLLLLFVAIAAFVWWTILAGIPLTYLNALSEDVAYTDSTRSASTSLFYLWMFRRSWPALIVAGLLFAPNRFWRMVMGVAWIANLLFYVAGANRTSVFTLLSITTIVYYLNKNRRPSPFVLAAAALMILALSGTLVLSRGRLAPTLNSESVVEAAAGEIMDRGAATGLMGVMYTFPGRAPHVGLTAVSDLLVAWIPRALWPAKPSLTPVQDLANLYVPTAKAHAPGALGIYYAGFSVAGVVFIMMLYGGLAAYVYRLWQANPRDPFLQLFLAACPATIWTLVHRGPPTFALLVLLYNFGPVVTVWIWARRRQRELIPASRSTP